MCGIIGISGNRKDAVRDALSTLGYRGPDAREYFSDEYITLGHARLSIIDLDARSNQPFFDEKREIGIVFNGEIYNHKELRAELEREHMIRFRTSSDTEVLVYAYRVWGEKMLPKLRGMFALAIYDQRTRAMFFARDHAGIKPLYYSISDARCVFASELKGVVHLMKSEGLRTEVDTGAVKLYPVFGYIPTPLTLVKGVHKLERGSWLRYDLNTNHTEQGLWKPETRTVVFQGDLETAIRESIIEHCVADVPVGTFFSGGVDSSLIAAVLHDAGMNLETFSIRVEGRTADEPFLKEIARHLGVKAHIADFGVTEFDEMYDQLLSLIDDPIADTSIFPTTFVSKLAAEKVKVVLSGEGGDELFLGYPRSRRLASMRETGSKSANWFGLLFKKTPQFRGKNKFFSELAVSAGLPIPYYLLQLSPARDLSSSDGWKTAEEMLANGDPVWFDRDWYLENMLLRKTDMATSYASIEGRVPLLGAEIWNAAPAFITANVVTGGSKEILKTMLAQYIPRELIDRPKSGFGISIEQIFRESKKLGPDFHEALHGVNDIGIATDGSEEEMIKTRYPGYGFGLVMLYRAALNLGIV